MKWISEKRIQDPGLSIRRVQMPPSFKSLITKGLELK